MLENPLHKLLYSNLSSSIRMQQGIFFTKQHIVQEIITNIALENVTSIVDTCAGAGDFLIPLALNYPDIRFYGIEKNPTVYSVTKQFIAQQKITNIHYFQGDVLLDEFEIPECDLYLGNPPFVHHSILPQEYREKIIPLWKRYSVKQKGFELLLGSSRSDIAQLIFHYSIERYLRNNGKFTVILPNSLLKGKASCDFREFNNLNINEITDISGKKAFEDTDRACFYISGTKSGKTKFPIPYHQDNETKLLYRSNNLLIAAEDKQVLGKCSYTARQGINTLGANSIFFFKKQPPFASPLLKPLLKSSDVNPFHYNKSYWVLLPYTDNGALISENDLQLHYPIAYNYLLKHKDVLQNRKSRFIKQCWYALFGIGQYTFTKYKVVWRGLGAKALQACVVTDGIPNQAMHCYFSTNNHDEAHYLCSILNQPAYNDQLTSINESGAKSFAQPNTIHRLLIPSFDSGNLEHQELALFSRKKHITNQ
jgi:hypothetical protein